MKSPFQTILLGLFGFFILIGVGFMIMTKGDSASDKLPPVEVWGSVPAEAFKLVSETLLATNDSLKVNYRYVPAESFDQTFIEALADGVGPDLFILPQHLILKYENKIYPVPFTSLSERDYRDTYIQEAELFLSPKGILAMPFSVDPLLMYWNRNLFNNAGISSPPKTWDEFFSLVQKITARDNQGKITRSAVALGEFYNIKNAREIISALILQTDNPIVKRTGAEGLPKNVMMEGQTALSALNFYTEFANTSKPAYSWNRSLPNSFSAFTSGDLAVYFGFGSELKSIKDKNPNLDFDVKYFPELRGAKAKATFGRMLGLAVSRQSKNALGAFQVAILFGSKEGVKAWSDATGEPPVRRDLLADKPTDFFGGVLYDSALFSKGWLEPDGSKTDKVFRDMIESVTSGRAFPSEAVARASDQLSAVLIQRQ